eukprot:4584861-Lingulodinium_polyedra.AAC.1
MGFIGRRRSPTRPDGAHGSPMQSNGTRWNQMGPNGAIGAQRSPKGPNGTPVKPTESNGIQWIPNNA